MVQGMVQRKVEAQRAAGSSACGAGAAGSSACGAGAAGSSAGGAGAGGAGAKGPNAKGPNARADGLCTPPPVHSNAAAIEAMKLESDDFVVISPLCIKQDGDSGNVG